MYGQMMTNFEELSLDGFQIVRSDMFTHLPRKGEPTCTIWPTRVAFNKFTLHALNSCEFVRIEVNPRNRCMIVVPVSSKEKDSIFRLAEKCGISASEYTRQRALGYEPRAVLPDAFFIFCEKLDALTEAPFSKEVNKSALKLIRDMNAALISPGKERDATWLPQASGPSEGS